MILQKINTLLQLRVKLRVLQKKFEIVLFANFKEFIFYKTALDKDSYYEKNIESLVIFSM